MSESLTGRANRFVSRRIAQLCAGRAVHVLHIGKTGGTAVKAALQELPYPPAHGLILHRHGFRLLDVPPGDLAVFFLRDPVSRFVSGFNSRKRKGQPRTYVEWSQAETDAFAAFSTPHALAEALGSARSEVRASAQSAMRAIQHVRSPYARWLGTPSYLAGRRKDILLIGRQEMLAADFERLKRRLGLPAKVRLPEDPVSAHRSPPDMPRDLSKRGRLAIEGWYENDYRLIEAAAALQAEGA